jgi:hypothetical protein
VVAAVAAVDLRRGCRAAEVSICKLREAVPKWL